MGEIMAEYLVDIEGSDSISFDYGFRYRGWYVTKTPLRTEILPLGYNDLTYSFPVYNYRYQFIMPAKLDFLDGMISYSTAERKLGVFRFPADEKGHYCTPLSAKEIEDLYKNLTEEDLIGLLKTKSVLTFEAFRIPIYNFEYFYLSDHNSNEIAEIANLDFSKKIMESFRTSIESRVSEVLEKIKADCDYLLILENILNLRRDDFSKISVETNNIIIK
jgi:hypothetical protein